MKLCLNMIVKNEAARITRALDSAAQYIDSWVITDTGSTDDTEQVIKDYFAAHHIPGIIHHAPFDDWSQARNAALTAARTMRRRFQWDYLLLMDADMELKMIDFAKFQASLQTDALAYDMEQRAGELHYANRRLVSAHALGVYRGVTHEYLDVDTGGVIPSSTAYFVDHADGSNRPEKYKRDIRLLLDGISREPDNSRYFYYLAQSYRDAGQPAEAAKWYRKRVAAGGWAEEQWSAQVNLAHTLKDQGDEDGFVREMLVAYNMRPTRAESLYDLAHHFRLKDDKQPLAALFAEVGMSIPRTNDLLFVNDFVYGAGLKEEFAITGFYHPAKRAKAFDVCQQLAITPGPYAGARHSARSNLYFYLPKLADVCPSFVSKRIPFEPPEHWIAMNPSVTNHGTDQRLLCNVRCVNYRIDDQGRYLIRANDGTANNSNPINTRNFMVDMGYDPMTDTKPETKEILTPALPCEFPAVIGFEDLRLFSAEGILWGSATVRQIHWDGNCEQVVARVTRRPDGLIRLEDWKRMLPAKRETEKNWAPIGVRPDDHREMLWMHRPGVTINDKGEFVHNNPAPFTNDIINGGSQLIGFGPGYLALVHSSHLIPGSPCRYYYHRWAVYDAATFKLISLSLPFVFDDKQIEFAAGLARHPTDKSKLVISYGSRDAEARIATISEQEVMRFLWSPSKL